MNPNFLTDGGGLSLYSYPTEQFKAGLLSLSVLTPVREREGMLASLLFSVLRRGCKSYPTLDALNRRLDYLYGTELSLRSYARGDRLVTGVVLELLDGAYLPEGENDLMEDALAVVRELLFCPLLDGEGKFLSRYVESEKEHMCNRIRARKSHPSAYAVHRCRALLYENDPTGVLYRVTEEDVASVTPTELTAFYRRFLKEMHLRCFYVGPKPAKEVLDVLHCHFGDCVKGERQALPASVTPPPLPTPRRVDETLPVTQGHLVLAFSTATTVNDPLFFACKVFNEMLGGSPVSRYFLEVRERRGLCYSCSSSYDSYKGVIFAVCGLETSARKEAEAAMLEQLQALACGDFSDEELAMEKQSLQNIYRQTEDNPGSIENFYFSRAEADALLSAEECSRRTAAVTREEVLRVAERISLNVAYFLEGTLAGEEEACDEED